MTDFFENGSAEAVTTAAPEAPKKRGRPKKEAAAPATNGAEAAAPKKRGRPAGSVAAPAAKASSYVSVMLTAVQGLKDSDRELFGKIAVKLEGEKADARQRITQALVKLFA